MKVKILKFQLYLLIHHKKLNLIMKRLLLVNGFSSSKKLMKSLVESGAKRQSEINGANPLLTPVMIRKRKLHLNHYPMTISEGLQRKKLIGLWKRAARTRTGVRKSRKLNGL